MIFCLEITFQTPVTGTLVFNFDSAEHLGSNQLIKGHHGNTLGNFKYVVRTHQRNRKVVTYHTVTIVQNFIYRSQLVRRFN